MAFRDVLPGRRQRVNLEITATSPYEAADPSRNGINRDSLGQISVASGTSVDLVFRLVDDATWRPAVLNRGPLCFSVLGLEDEISAAGFAALALADDSVLRVANDSGGVTHIWGPSWPPPSGERRAGPAVAEGSRGGAANTTGTGRRRAVSFLFADGPEFQLSLSVAPGAPGGGRDFVFGGLSTLVAGPAEEPM